MLVIKHALRKSSVKFEENRIESRSEFRKTQGTCVDGEIWCFDVGKSEMGEEGIVVLHKKLVVAKDLGGGYSFIELCFVVASFSIGHHSSSYAFFL